MDKTIEEKTFVGHHKDKQITYQDGKLVTVKYTSETCFINNGIKLDLNKITTCNFKTDHGSIEIDTKLLSMTNTHNELIVEFELIIDNKVSDHRKVTYRWQDEK